MKKQLVYDLPLRIFHFLFATIFISIFLITKLVDDESIIFTYHMLAGFVFGFIVLLRIIWGAVGTKYSRFTSFALRPKDLRDYLIGILTGSKYKWAGHNPASSWAALLMLTLALGLGLTGYLMASGYKETFEDIHEIFANGLLVVALLHIAGVLLHSLRHRDGIIMTMYHGAKSDISTAESISKTRPAVALLFIVLVAAFATQLARNFDTQKQTLSFFGDSLHLGENERDNDSHHDDD